MYTQKFDIKVFQDYKTLLAWLNNPHTGPIEQFSLLEHSNGSITCLYEMGGKI